MVSFKFAALAFGASVLSEVVMATPAGHLGLARREHRLALRQATGTEAYPTDTTPTCADGLDTQNTDGTCQCGPGRVQASADSCEVDTAAANDSDFTVFNLAGPVALDFPITTSFPVTALREILTARQCEAICEVEAACIGFYLQPGPVESQCWKIGADGAYSDPRTTGIPFTASTSTKRADGVTGSIGQAGGVLGIDAAQDNDPTATCVTGVDTRNADFTCTCGTGRVSSNDANTGCKTAASQAAMRRQRRRSDVYEGVPW